MRHIIGLALCYRKFTANFSNMVRSLTDFMKKNTPFNWSHLCQSTIKQDTIKIRLISSPTLIFSDFNEPCVLSTDASNTVDQE